MREAVIVSVARTPIGKAYRGAFNDTDAPVLAAHCVTQALARAGVEGAEVEDLILGCAAQQGNQGYNIARLTVAAAGLPVTVAGMTIDRMCASGLMAVATAAKQIVQDRMPVVVAGGVESISLVQNKHKNAFRAQTPAVIEHMPHMYMQMIETAEIVARRYGVSRETQDEYALQSQQRTAAAQAAGRFAEELAPLATVKTVEDKATGEIRRETGDAQPRRGAARGHDARGARRAQARMVRRQRRGAGRVHHRGQRLAALGWRGGAGADGLRSSRSGAGSSRSAPTAAWRSPVARPRRWASDPCSPCRSCSSARGSASTTSGSGS